ncbi:unnamed protein product [Closterium sp. NIES-53]
MLEGQNYIMMWTELIEPQLEIVGLKKFVDGDMDTPDVDNVYGSRFCRRTSAGATQMVVLPTKLLRGMELQEAAEEEGEGEAEAMGEALAEGEAKVTTTRGMGALCFSRPEGWAPPGMKPPSGERARGGAVQGSGAQGSGAQGKTNPRMFLMVEDVKESEGDVGSVGKVVMHPLTHWVIDSGALLPVIGVGNAKVMGANEELVGLGNVLLVEGLSAYLLSVHRLQKSKAKVTFNPTNCRAKLGKLLLWDLEEKSSCIKDLWQLPIIPWNGKLPATAAAAATAKATAEGEKTVPTDGTLDAVKKVQQPQQPHGEVLAGVDASAAWAKGSCGSGEADWETWHERLCHVNFPMLQKLLKDGSLKGLEVKGAKEIGSCPKCLGTKFTKFPFSSGMGPAKALLVLVLMDVVAPPLSGSHSFLTIVDDHTRAVWVYPLKTKGEVAAAVLKEWMPRAQRESGHKVKVIRTDNGGEFIGNEFEAEGARNLLGRAGPPDSFWVTALRQVAIVKNRVVATVGDKQWVPYTKWYGSAPAVNMLRAYGCMVVFHVPKEKRGKLEASGRWGVHLGISKDHKGWLVWDLTSQKLTILRDVKQVQVTVSDEEISWVTEDGGELEVEQQQQQDAPPRAERPPDRPWRDVRPPNRLTYPSFGKAKVVRAGSVAEQCDEDEIAHCYWAAVLEPKTLAEALSGLDAEKWKQSVKEEYDSLLENETWELCELPPGKKAISSKLIFRHKYGPDGELTCYKSRLYSAMRQRQQRGVADSGKGEMLLTCYTDASFNAVKADGTSIEGYVCLFGGGAVSWRSKKQNEVGLSSCETEYMALHHGAKQVVWLRRLLEEIGVCQKEPTKMLYDNEIVVDDFEIFRPLIFIDSHTFLDEGLDAENLLEVVHIDLCDPFRVAAKDGRLHFLLLKDRKTRFVWLHPIAKKSDVLGVFEKWLKLVEQQTTKLVKMLRSDRGGEFLVRAFTDLADHKGILHDLTCPYTPWQNVMAEREMRTVVWKADHGPASARTRVSPPTDSLPTAIPLLAAKDDNQPNAEDAPPPPPLYASLVPPSATSPPSAAASSPPPIANLPKSAPTLATGDEGSIAASPLMPTSGIGSGRRDEVGIKQVPVDKLAQRHFTRPKLGVPPKRWPDVCPAFAYYTLHDDAHVDAGLPELDLEVHVNPHWHWDISTMTDKEVYGANYDETNAPVGSYVTLMIFHQHCLCPRPAPHVARHEELLLADQAGPRALHEPAVLLERRHRPETSRLVGYAAADEADDKQKRSSTNGYVFIFGGTAVSATTKAGKEAHLRFLLVEFQLLNVGTLTVLNMDHQSIIMSAERLELEGNLKHMKRRYVWLQQMVKCNKIALQYIPTTEQPSDFHIKALHFRALNRCFVAVGQVRLTKVGDKDVQE